MLWSIHYIRLYCLLQKAYLSLMAPSDFSAESHPPWPHMRISRHESDMAASAWPSPVHNDFLWEFPCKRFLWFFNRCSIEYILAQQTVRHSSSIQTTPWPQGLNTQEDETCLVLVYWKTEEFVSKQVLHVNTMTAQVILNLLLLAYASATFTFYSE